MNKSSLNQGCSLAAADTCPYKRGWHFCPCKISYSAAGKLPAATKEKLSLQSTHTQLQEQICSCKLLSRSKLQRQMFAAPTRKSRQRRRSPNECPLPINNDAACVDQKETEPQPVLKTSPGESPPKTRR